MLAQGVMQSAGWSTVERALARGGGLAGNLRLFTARQHGNALQDQGYQLRDVLRSAVLQQLFDMDSDHCFRDLQRCSQFLWSQSLGQADGHATLHGAQIEQVLE